MALQYHPNPGAVVMARFPTDFLHGEMEKCRPVVIVSRKCDRGRPLCATVVPLSMTAPNMFGDQHVVVPASVLPRGIREAPGTRFAKCDCVNTLSLARMDFVAGPRIGGRRKYEICQVPDALLLDIRRAVASVLEIREITGIEGIDCRVHAL